jgi:acetyltransferase-like isoleucine patch superfamily enzyme
MFKLQRLITIVLTTLLASIPSKAIGSNLRTLLYPLVFRRIGKHVFIQDGIEFLSPENIELGNHVRLHRGTYISANGNKNNQIYLADGVQFAQGVNITALNNTKILIDESTFIGPYVCIAGPGNITIGKNCLIAANCGIFANNHIFSDLTVDIAAQDVTREGITIEDGCWLGHGVTILDGVTIGRGSVIGAGSVVTKNIPPYSVAVGVPAKVIKSRKGEKTLNITKEQIVT